mmetsp:Transcript_1032/g.2019  ORF Transcript_1032/g.2019 Transcript_1032/m.2019 type:complete len:102 (+) Transcript_1032:60-365(+)
MIARGGSWEQLKRRTDGVVRMVYIEDWDQFQAAARALFESDPVRTRYAFKYRAKRGELVLKVTDNRECVMFKTDQRADLKKFETLTAWMVENMATAAPDES